MPLTYAQIIDLACTDAHAPGMQAIAGEKLTSLLGSLSLNRNLAICRGVYYFTFNPSLISSPNQALLPGSGPYNLPADYLRTEMGDAFFMLNGVPYDLVPIDLEEFDMQVQQMGIQNYPRWFTTDVSQSPPVAYFYPPAFAAFPVTIRYFRKMPEVATPESSNAIPWFPDQSILQLMLTAHMMVTTDDSRAGQMMASAGQMLSEYLRLEGDRGGRTTRIKKDPRSFGSSWQNLPMSKTVG